MKKLIHLVTRFFDRSPAVNVPSMSDVAAYAFKECNLVPIMGTYRIDPDCEGRVATMDCYWRDWPEKRATIDCWFLEDENGNPGTTVYGEF